MTDISKLSGAGQSDDSLAVANEWMYKMDLTSRFTWLEESNSKSEKYTPNHLLNRVHLFIIVYIMPFDSMRVVID